MILLITIDYPPIEGGISTLARNLVDDLSARGERVVVVAPRVGGEKRTASDGAVRIVRAPFYHTGYLRFVPLALISGWLLLRYGIRKVIAMNIAYGGIVAYCFGKILPLRYVVFAYGFEFLKFEQSGLLSKLYGRIYMGARKVIAVSGFTRRALDRFGVPRETTMVSYPEIDAPAWNNPQEGKALEDRFDLKGKRIILSVSRLIRRKGHHLLLAALPAVFQAFSEARCCIVGKGPEEKKLKKLAAELGIQEEIIFPGYLPADELAALYHLAEIFVLTPIAIEEAGDYEGFGIVFLEAAACGLPVIASRSGGVEEAVLDNETGLLVPPGQPEAITSAVLKLLNEPDYANKLGKAGKARTAEQFHRGELAGAIVGFLQETRE